MPSRLLLADDSVTIQRVIELTFADEEVEVVAVGDGREAIERIRADPPDIVLADIGMPERDGYEVAAFLKSQPQLAHIPIILLTGAFEPIDEARARAVGSDGVLVKPFEPQLVISRVRELLSGHRQTTPAELPVAPSAASDPGNVEEAGTMPVAAGGLEEYFDRLDAALAGHLPRLPATSSSAPHEGPVDERHTARPPGDARAGGARPAAARAAESISMSDAFAALLAAEEGYAAAPAAPFMAPVSEELIDEIVRRVIARLGDRDMRRLVLDSAERLVREEIERIKAR